MKSEVVRVVACYSRSIERLIETRSMVLLFICIIQFPPDAVNQFNKRADRTFALKEMEQPDSALLLILSVIGRLIERLAKALLLITT